jgi:hypothetical protein
MAKIEFSAGMMSGLPQRILQKSTSATTSDSPSNVGLIAFSMSISGFIHLNIFKGTKPTKAEMIASRNLSTASTPFKLALTNDSLIRFETTTSASSYDFSPSIVSNPSSIATVYKAAFRAGTATWFCLAHGKESYTPGTLGNFIVGDVGVIGSGADLEIPDTNIIVGELYRVSNFKISFPSFWEY